MRHLLLGEVYKVCQTVAWLPLCPTELFLNAAHARRRQTDAKVHVARERVIDTHLRLPVSRGAGRTLLGLLCWVCGCIKSQLSVGEKGGELSETWRELREL